HQREVLCAAFSADGRRLATGGRDLTVQIWDSTAGPPPSGAAAPAGPLMTLQGSLRKINAVAFSADGRRIAAGSEDGVARIWNAGTGQEISTFKGGPSAVLAVTFSPDGGRLATGHEDHTARIWDAATGEQIRLLQGHADAVISLAVSADGRRVVTGSR